MGFWSAMFYAVKIVGIISGAIIIAAKIISILLTWADGKDKGYVCMKFRQWRKLYDLNPEEWHADSDNPYRCIYTDRCHKDIYVRFLSLAPPVIQYGSLVLRSARSRLALMRSCNSYCVRPKPTLKSFARRVSKN